MEKKVGKYYVASDVLFYTIEQVSEMTGWSGATVHKLFNSPDFPSVDYGKSKLVEAHALLDYFSRKRVKSEEPYWRT